MAVSKRLRYEILRRDGYKCRYCGRSAPEVTLTVDHVTPVALGGSDGPDNLVPACHECNAGKSATPPDAPLVADVADSALRWARAIRQAADKAGAREDAFMDYWGIFLEQWPKYRRLPTDARDAVRRLYVGGLPDWMLIDAAETALYAPNVSDRFRYFCGVARNMLIALQADAKAILDDEAGDS